MNEQYGMEELIPLVAWLTDKYTSKESTSVPYNTARQLMGAVLYSIREYEAGCEKEQFAVRSAARPSAAEAYEKGYQLLLERVEQAKLLYHEILADFCCYRNQAYRETFESGLPAFFIHYDVRFNPQNHILTLDYPLLVSLDHTSGIDRIILYLKCIGLEQQFLKQLPEAFVLHVLSAYHPMYEELFVNVAGIVLRNLTGCALAGKKVDCSGYNEQQIQRISNLANSHTTTELDRVIESKLDELIRLGYGADTELSQYLGAEIHNISTELKTAAEHGHLERILAIAGS